MYAMGTLTIPCALEVKMGLHAVAQAVVSLIREARDASATQDGGASLATSGKVNYENRVALPPWREEILSDAVGMSQATCASLSAANKKKKKKY